MAQTESNQPSEHEPETQPKLKHKSQAKAVPKGEAGVAIALPLVLAASVLGEAQSIFTRVGEPARDFACPSYEQH